MESLPARQSPPVYNVPADRLESPLRKFISLQKDALLVLGPRRNPPLICPASSTSTALSVVTAFGFTMLEYTEYVIAVQKLRPDIVIGIGDIIFGHKPGAKRLEKMADRTLSWTSDLIEAMGEDDQGTPSSVLFAPILPIGYEMQRFYLEALGDNFQHQVSGFAIYDASSVDIIPEHLSHLPNLHAGYLGDPHQILLKVDAGLDLLSIPFINEATDAGIALNFVFAERSNHNPIGHPHQPPGAPLGLDLWQPQFVTDLSPISDYCTCYTCSNHHRAYIHHLLNAKEMLAWVLLQIHNHHTIDGFFTAIRSSLQDGTFEEHKEIFHQSYCRELPVQSGKGPRIRGYQVKSVGGDPKMNPIAWNQPMNDKSEKLAEELIPSPGIESTDVAGK